jgi:hypothetical protein
MDMGLEITVTECIPLLLCRALGYLVQQLLLAVVVRVGAEAVEQGKKEVVKAEKIHPGRLQPLSSSSKHNFINSINKPLQRWRCTRMAMDSHSHLGL